MSQFSNIWNHPKTSAAGLLIAVGTIAGALSQQGISLGKAGSGSVITLVTAVATALLGLLAKDPDGSQPSSGQAGGQAARPAVAGKLGAWLLIALLLPPMQGCTAAGAAQDIVNWTPSLQSAVATVDSTAALLAPADAPIFTAATTGFDAASNLLVTQADAYLANPSATTLAQLQNLVVTLQQQVNAALLQAAGIKDSASQLHATAAIQAVGTIVSAMLSLVQSVSSKTAVAQMAAHSTIKLASVQPYINTAQAAKMIAAHYNEPVAQTRIQVAQVEKAEINAGF
jgi:hypothetical protein